MAGPSELRARRATRRETGCRRTGPAAPLPNRRRAAARCAAPVSMSSFSVAMIAQRRIVALHDDRRIFDNLRRMHGGRDRRRLVDKPELAKNALLEIGEAGALAGPSAGARHRDAADDAEIELRHLLEPDRLAVLQKALRGRGGLEVDAFGGELLRIDAQIRKAFCQIGHRARIAACPRRARAAAPGFAADRGCTSPRARFPGSEFAEAFGGGVGADEIRDAIEGRPDVDAITRQSSPKRAAAPRFWPGCARPSARSRSCGKIRDRRLRHALALERARDPRARGPRARAPR